MQFEQQGIESSTVGFLAGGVGSFSIAGIGSEGGCKADFILGSLFKGRNSSSSSSKNMGVDVSLLTMDSSVVASMKISGDESGLHDF